MRDVTAKALLATTAILPVRAQQSVSAPQASGGGTTISTTDTGQSTIAPPSGLQPADWDTYAYPAPSTAYGRDPAKDPVIDVGNGHKLHAQEFGNPKGEPLIVLHGGPGGGADTIFTRYFDPKRYRIILFDQRGCGHSTPTTYMNFDAAMNKNNTASLVEDINAVRNHFGIKGKMHLQGGSWGTTLALAYAIKYPENVKSLQLRGVFLGTKKGVDYVFQGNAATYQEAEKQLTAASTPEEVRTFMENFNKQDFTPEGAYRAYMGDGSQPGQIPAKYHATHRHMAEAYAKAWDEFVRQIPKAERGNMIDAYVKRLEAKADQALAGTGKFDAAANTIDPEYQNRLALASSKWEGTISRFSHAVEANGSIDLAKFAKPKFAVDFARLELRYSRDGFYLTEDGSPAPAGSNYLVDGLSRIAKHNIPMMIVHGANDQVCPVRDAQMVSEKYEAALKQAGHAEPAPITFITPGENGHSMMDKGNAIGIIDLARNAPAMSVAEKMGGPREPGSQTPGSKER